MQTLLRALLFFSILLTACAEEAIVGEALVVKYDRGVIEAQVQAEAEEVVAESEDEVRHLTTRARTSSQCINYFNGLRPQLQKSVHTLGENAMLNSAAALIADANLICLRCTGLSHSATCAAKQIPADLGSRVSLTGYRWASLGENLYLGRDDCGAAWNAWINSPGHKENLLNTEFSETGFAISSPCPTGQVVMAQVFAVPAK